MFLFFSFETYILYNNISMIPAVYFRLLIILSDQIRTFYNECKAFCVSDLFPFPFFLNKIHS